ncbi:MAG: dihydropyrimidinase [Pseudomonadota bacterium]
MADPFDLVIRGGRIVTQSSVIDGDLAISDGRIAMIGKDLSGAEEINASGRWVMPGGVDPHCHIEQISGMGVMNADTFKTATKSAAMGGTTSVISFAAQAHGQPLAEALDDYAARAKRGAMVDHAFHLSISDTSVDRFFDDLGKLVEAGHRSIKVFTTYNIKLSDRAILDILAAAKVHGALVCVHAENDGLIGWTKEALVAAGLTRPEHHAISHPRLAEIEAVERLCRFAEFFATPVMLFHISTAEALEAIRNARGRGVPIWAETCPHYLFMTAEVLQRDGIEGAKWMCSPPQRTVGDQEALWGALDRGDLQVVSSDHAPYRFDETGKLRAGEAPTFPEIANGLPGLEPRLALMFDAMVAGDRLGAQAFARVTASEPARIYGLPRKGQIAPGFDADIAIWNAEESRTYGANDLHDNVGYNPWEGRTVQGVVETVLLRGKPIVREGEFLGEPGQGQWLHRESLGVEARIQPAPEYLATQGGA